MTKEAAAKRLKQDRKHYDMSTPCVSRRIETTILDDIEETSPIQENDEDVVNSIRKQFRL